MKLQKLNKSYFVLADNNKEIGSFQMDSDGSYYFWINEETSGCWTAYDLGEIAKLLDSVNMQFDREVDEYFDLLRKEQEDEAKENYFILLKTGMFFEIYPTLTGVWEEDKDEYSFEYNQIKNQLNF